MVKILLKGARLVLLTFAVVLVVVPAALARPEYAKKEGQRCSYCHINYAAGYFTYRGMYYRLHNRSFASFDNLAEAKLAGVSPYSEGNASAPVNEDYPTRNVPAALNFTVKDRQGNPVKLARYLGDVVLVVNVASDSDNMSYFKSLDALYGKYKDKGLVVLGFPTSDLSIHKAAFPMFSKTVVQGNVQAPLYKFLTDTATNPKFGGAIEGSFDKFLISRKGEIVGRFKSGVDPFQPDVVRAIEKELSGT